jgi:hypothetical protein
MIERDRTPQLIGVLAAVIAVVLAMGIVVVVVDDEPGVPASGARATVEGVVLVVHRDGSSSPLESGDLVAGGDEVRVQSGTVVLELASGALLEGREGRSEDDGRFAVEGTRVAIDSTPELLAGDLLVRGGVPVTVGAGGNEVAFAPDGNDGAVKIRRGLSVTGPTREPPRSTPPVSSGPSPPTGSSAWRRSAARPHRRTRCASTRRTRGIFAISASRSS